MIGGIAALLGLPPEALYLFIAMTVARPIGLFFGFFAFLWALRQGFLLRTSIALVFGLPISIATRAEISELAAGASVIDLAFLIPKEFALGYVLGFIASMPLLALQYAGALTDSFRGESSPGAEDPSGGMIGSWSTYLLIIGMLIFFSTGGLQGLIGALYQSYSIWPTTAALPRLQIASVWVLVDLISVTLRSTIIVAAPLLIVLMSVEFALAVGSRMAQRFDLMSLEFAVKNFLAVLLIPVMTLYVLRYLGETPVDFGQIISAMQAALR